MSLNFFRYAGQLPMVEVLGGYFVQGSHRFYDPARPINDDTQNNAPPHWVRIGERGKPAFAVTLSHILEEEFLQVMGKRIAGRSEWELAEDGKALEKFSDMYFSKWACKLTPSNRPMTCVSWFDGEAFMKRASSIAKIAYDDNRPMILPSASRMEYITRGGHNGVIDIRQMMKREGVEGSDFVKWATDRFENFVTVNPNMATESMIVGATIYSDPRDPRLKDILKGNEAIYAWRMHGTPDGTIIGYPEYDEPPFIERAWGHNMGMPSSELEMQCEMLRDQLDAGMIHPLALSGATGVAWCWTDDDSISDLRGNEVGLRIDPVVVNKNTKVKDFKELRGGAWNVFPGSAEAAYRYVHGLMINNIESYGLRGVVNL